MAAGVRLLFVILCVLLLVPGWTGDPRLDLLGNGPGHVTASPVLLDDAHPERRRVGRLFFVGGVALASPVGAFGGYSSLAVDGDRFTLLSDGGNIVRFRMGADWRPRDVYFADLPAGPGSGWQKLDRDSESMAADPRTGQVWVGFETYNQIWRYDAGFARAEARAEPPAMQSWPENGGAESMARLPGGGMLLIAEDPPRREDQATRPVLVWPGDPTVGTPAFRFRYRPPPGRNPSDAAALPDGSLVIINRRFRLPYRFDARLTLVPAAAIAPGRTVEGEDIGALEAPLIHDNFEGVAVTREGAATILWIVSDDNQSRLQRTLLLKFRLLPGQGQAGHHSRSS